MIVALLGVTALAGFHLFANTFTYPFHASCHITWEVDRSCDEVKQLLTKQIEAWSNNNCPNVSESCPKLPCGMQCKYELMPSDKPGELKCLHKTVVEEYIDYLTFTFADYGEENEDDDNSDDADDQCTIYGYSTSGVWYALLDYGVNYCNLRNLIDGSGLARAPGFTEITNTSVCTMYDVRNCDRY